ncbi:MAG TPA: phosphatidylinositol-specific phospholipase C domain-containing protein [Pseudonocardiaceae bacterium]|nr:phosphatidylinositol-specific phospholipase C domain-containing protein [Pseudonocardiaceae bacterium]
MLLSRIRHRFGHHARRAGLVATVVGLSAITVTALTAAPASADTGSDSLAQSTVVGVHNTYNPADYPYLAQALDAGAQMIELDAWDDVFTQEWKVGHDSLTSNSNNCVNASSPADLYTGSANKDLNACLDDIKYWLAAHPTAGPIYVKVELKAGFQNNLGLGPAEFDSYVNGQVGSILYRPADLLAGKYSTLDAAAKANAWPSRASLAGKMIMYVIPGTVELANPTDTLHTDVEYATYVKNLYASGKIATATTFPTVLGAATGDPRTQYSDTTIRPWFVFFDGDANTYVTTVDTSWYDTNHYILVMTDAQNVSPTLSDTNPSVSDAQARVAQLAADHASVVSNDWSSLPAVLSETLPRG